MGIPRANDVGAAKDDSRYDEDHENRIFQRVLAGLRCTKIPRRENTPGEDYGDNAKRSKGGEICLFVCLFV
jgi:hypothetical protein